MSNRRVMICHVSIFYFDRKEWTESALLVSLYVFRLNGTFDENVEPSPQRNREERGGGTKPQIHPASAARSACPCTTE